MNISWFSDHEEYLYAVGFANKRLHKHVSLIIEISLIPNLSHVVESTWISSCAPSTFTNSSSDQTPTIMNTQIMRENTCTSAAWANHLLGEFRTLQFSKMISYANGNHDN